MPGPQNPPRVEEPQAAYDPAVAGVHAVQQLEQSGFSRPQAESVVAAVRELAGDLATKEDLAILKNELRAEMAGLKGELRAEMAGLKGELQAEMAGLKGELQAEIAAVKGELKSEIAQSEARLSQNAFRNTLWTVGVFLAAIAIATAILLAALQP